MTASLVTLHGMFDAVPPYLWNALVATATQLLVLLGPGLAIALVMHVLSGVVQDRALRLLGPGLYLGLFKGVGTVVHEAGHAIFCILFRHRITAIRWFDRNPRDGAYGYVSHSYDPRSPYQRIGNFFIGIGPIVLAALVLYWAAGHLVGASVFAPMRTLAITGQSAGSAPALWATAVAVWQGALTVLVRLFSAANSARWQFYLFLYLAFSVGSSVRLSPADLEGAAGGLGALAGGLLLVNLATLWAGDLGGRLAGLAGPALATFYAVMIFAVVVVGAVAAAVLVLQAVGAVAARAWRPARA